MSKFFNETIKARDLSYSTESIKNAAIEDYQEAAGAPKPAGVESRNNGLERSPRLATSVSRILETQFHGSDVLDSARESYRALRTRLFRLRSANGTRSVVISSATQGEGKTFTSLNLAVCCAQLQNTKVLLIDGDIRSRGLSCALGSPEGRGLADVLAGECTAEQAVLSTELPNLYVMDSGNPSALPAELLAGTRWQELVAWCHQRFMITLVDSPPVLNLTDTELLTAACDGLLMVVRAQKTKREILQRAASQIDSKKLLGVVFNGAEGAQQQYPYYGLKES